MSDLTKEEQANVRKALRFLRARAGSWAPIAKALGADVSTLKSAGGSRAASASLAVRVARLAKVGVDDVLGGEFPPEGVCPHCGHGEIKPA